MYLKVAKYPILILTVLIYLTEPGFAFFRHLCHGQLGIARVDPLMSPGKASQHVHNIQGASNFGFDSDAEALLSSNCTSCSVRQDKSAYWAPQMYFQHENGTFEVVPTHGGLTIYYFVESPRSKGEPVKVEPFPPGFRMIAGMSTKRKLFGPTPDPPMGEWKDYDLSQQSLLEKSIGFNCLGPDDGKIEGALYRHQMPDRAKIDTCNEGVRAELQFPSCWDGINLDSENHTTHVAYPYGLRDGDCPEGFNVRLPTLLYETIYNTLMFKGFPGRFTFAQGDHTGNGYHGDFINGWEDGVLQQVITHCNDALGSGLQEKCHVLDIKPESEVYACKMEIPEILQSENVALVDQLPGGCKVVANTDFSGDCGASGNQPAAPEPNLQVSSEPASPTSTSSYNEIAPSYTANPEMTIPETTAPSTPLSHEAGVTTYTSVTTAGGTVLNYIIVETLITTTVTVNEPEPSSGAGMTLEAKRHGHRHPSDTDYNTSLHSHGAFGGRKKRKDT